MNEQILEEKINRMTSQFKNEFKGLSLNDAEIVFQEIAKRCLRDAIIQ